jgi:hypothetical protein
LPTPAVLVQRICVCATFTVQPLAVYVVAPPAPPYVAVTVFAVVGPKLVPVRVIAVPPAVGIDEPPPTVVIAGGVYDRVALDTALA